MRPGLAIGIAAICVVGAAPVTTGTNSLPAGRTRVIAQQAPDQLPDGEGKRILQSACTACHDLSEVTKFKGFYTREEWQDIVTTMVAYGAPVKGRDVEVLVEYLTRVLGKKAD